MMLLCRNYFSDAADVDEGLSLLARAVTATGLGIAVAAFITPIAAARMGPRRWIGVSIAIGALGQSILAIHLDITVFFIAVFVLGLTGQASKICVDAVIQQTVDDGFRGRVFAFYDMIFNAAFVAAAGLSVLLLPADGESAVILAVVAAIFATASGAYLFAEHRWDARTPSGPESAGRTAFSGGSA
jgi:MFS family permease